jgi:hypothetical protein
MRLQFLRMVEKQTSDYDMICRQVKTDLQPSNQTAQ